MPEHLMHKKTPLYLLVSEDLNIFPLDTYKFHEAHRGSTTHCQHIKPKPAGATHHFVYNPHILCSPASSGAPSAPLHVSPSSPCPVSLASCVVVVVRQSLTLPRMRLHGRQSPVARHARVLSHLPVSLPRTTTTDTEKKKKKNVFCHRESRGTSQSNSCATR